MVVVRKSSKEGALFAEKPGAEFEAPGKKKLSGSQYGHVREIEASSF